jgi:hypothetical protein
MKPAKSIFVSVGFAIALTGCGSPKEASKENFKDVISNYLDNSCIMVSPGRKGFPITLELRPSDEKWAATRNIEITKRYDALVGIGMLEVEDGSTQVRKNLYNDEMITVPTKIYSFSKKGEEAYRKKEGRGFLGGPRQGFCVATYKVNEVSSFSEPSQAMGYTISNVNFSVSPKDIKDWATNESITKAFPRLAAELAENQKKSTILVLMNDGWVHESEIAK